MNSFAEDITAYYEYQGFEKGKAEGKAEGKVEGKAENNQALAKTFAEYVISRHPKTLAEAISIIDEYGWPGDFREIVLDEVRSKLNLS